MSIKTFLLGVESKIKAPLHQLISFIVQDAKSAAVGNPMLSYLATDLEAAAADPTLVSEIETMIYDLLLSKRNKAPATSTTIPVAPLEQPAVASPAPSPTPALVLESPPAPVVETPAPAVPSAPVPQLQVPELNVIRPL